MQDVRAVASAVQKTRIEQHSLQQPALPSNAGKDDGGDNHDKDGVLVAKPERRLTISGGNRVRAAKDG